MGVGGRDEASGALGCALLQDGFLDGGVAPTHHRQPTLLEPIRVRFRVMVKVRVGVRARVKVRPTLLESLVPDAIGGRDLALGRKAFGVRVRVRIRPVARSW